MPYCTQADIEKLLDPAELVQLTDDNDDGQPDTGVVTEAIAQADAEIDSYLSARYAVPLSPAPVLVRKLSEDIAVWNLYSRRNLNEEVREKRYKAAVRLLEAIGAGRATLGVDPEPSGGEQSIQTSRAKTDRLLSIGKSDESGTLDNY